MTKFWESGRVKTRLGKTIGMEPAAALHRLFISYLCRSLAQAGDRREICVDPQKQVAALQKQLADWQLDKSWGVTDQGEGDLGDRMQRWFHRILREESSDRCMLIGGDCPRLVSRNIREAAKSLDHYDVVLGPAADGGYYLLGIRGPWRPAFTSLFQSVPWSTDQVMAVTQEKMLKAGLTWTELEIREDIDTIVELKRLRSSLINDLEHASLKRQMDEILSAAESDPEATK